MFCNESARRIQGETSGRQCGRNEGMGVVRVDCCTEQGALVRWDEMNWRSEQICSQEADGWNLWKRFAVWPTIFGLKRKAGAMSSKNSREEAEQLRVESVAKCPGLSRSSQAQPLHPRIQ